MGRAFAAVQGQVARVFTQRCFYLFFALLGLLAAAPFAGEFRWGRHVLNATNLFILTAAVAAVGRSPLSFAIVVLAAVPSAVLLWLGWAWQLTEYRYLGWIMYSLCYAITIAYLMAYVLRREVMTADKLFGAAAAYLLLGALWAYLYAILLQHFPNSIVAAGAPLAAESGFDLIYFSFTVLTSTGFGDIVPITPPARMLVLLEQIAGVLYLAILVARLAGIYSPAERHGS